MSKSRLAALLVALLVGGVSIAGDTQLRRLVRTGGVPTVPPIPSGGGAWPNEPAGFSVRSDYNFSDDPATAGDVEIGTSGWHVIYNDPPESTIQGWVTRTSDAGAPNSPPYIFDFVYPQGMVQGEAPATLYRYVSPTATEIYFAFYWKASTPFDLSLTGQKLVFMFNGGGGAGGQQFMAYDVSGYLIVLPEYPDYAASGNYVVLRPNVTPTLVTLGSWHRVEWYSNVSSGVVKWWLDGNLQGSYTGPAVNAYPFDMVQFSPTWGGCCSETKDQRDHYYFDHVKVSVAP